MSLYSIVTNVCDIIGLARPQAVYGSSEQTARTMLALLKKSGEELSRLPFEILKREAAFTTVATASQGLLTSIASDYKRMASNTMWNRTQRREIPGSMSDQRWGLFQASSMAGPFSEFYIRAGTLYFSPVPAAGHTIAFTYFTKNFCQSAAGVGQSAWAADTDTGVLPETLFEYDLQWRYLKGRGLVWEPDYQIFVKYRDELLAQDGRAPILSMTSQSPGVAPIRVPEGSW